MSNDYSKGVTIVGDQEKFTTIYYDTKGQLSNNSETETESAAIKIDYGKRAVYRVAVDKKRKLYDPMTKELVSAQTGMKLPKYKLTEVNKSCFDTYVSYLQKRHESLLNIAQREVE